MVMMIAVHYTSHSLAFEAASPPQKNAKKDSVNGKKGRSIA
jgi:hypothetical protein